MGFVIFIVIIALIIWGVSQSRKKPFMDISEFYSSGTLNKGEELKEFLDHSICFIDRKMHQGLIIFTNKRFLFLQKPPGWGSHGADLVLSISWKDVMSVSSSSGNVKITTRIDNLMATYELRDRKVDTKTLMDKIIGNKASFVDESVIEAKTVLIEEANKDKASEILQKRLARGEITLEEFHNKIQRT